MVITREQALTLLQASPTSDDRIAATGIIAASVLIALLLIRLAAPRICASMRAGGADESETNERR